MLLVESDQERVGRITSALSAESIRVDAVSTLFSARAAAAFYPFDVVIAAMSLPDGSGLELCRELAGAPVRRIVLSTGAIEDRVSAFEAGADDVVDGGSLSLRELALRVRAVGRRSTPPLTPQPAGPLRVGPICLDGASGLVEVHGLPVPLAPVERAVLEVLMSRPGRVLDRSTLMKRVWGDEVQDRTVDSAVKRLRARLGSAGERIETVRGAGYRLRE